jgi:hypothetical protein
LTTLYQRICDLEKLLQLTITVGTHDMLYLSPLSPEHNTSSPLRMRFQIRRDEYDGDAHLSFFIEGSTELLCGKNQLHSSELALKKKIEVSILFSCQADADARDQFSTSASS